MRRKISLLLLIVGIMGVIIYGLFWHNGLLRPEQLGITPRGKSLNLTNSNLTNRVNVLLIGADQRPGDPKYNTDSIIFATIDPQDRRVSLLSIPRDTRIHLAGYGYVKINSVVPLTDLATLQRSVEGLTGEPVAGYIQTNFAGFKQVIDTLGGITVDVEKNMYYETGDKEDGYINLHKGIQRLDGEKALQYARFRHDALADISRTARQQVVLKAIAQEMFQLSTVPKLPFIIPQLLKVVHTNLSAKEILVLSQAAVGFQSSNVIAQTLPGAFQDVDGVSYWKVDPAKVKTVINNLQQGITTNKVVDQEDIDLLKPVISSPARPLPKVPGNSQDPNGIKSTGYQIFNQGE